MKITRRFAAKSLTALAAAARDGLRHVLAQAADTIKVGVLHSLSGTMAISETVLKDTVLMTIARSTPRAACSARSSSRWWSTRRRTGRCSPRRPPADRPGQGRRCSAAGPRCPQVGAAGVRGELNGLLFYPVQYEGEELSPRTSSTPAPRPTSRPSRPSST